MSAESTIASHIKVSEAAHRSGVSINTVLRRIKDGRLPAVKVGKCYMVFAEDVELVFAPTLVVPQKASSAALEAAIAKAVAAAPPLTLAARDRIVCLLGGASA